MNIQLPLLVHLAGVAQITLALGSIAIPHILKWRAALVNVQPLIKQMFWTYAAYILVINFCFGLTSAFARGELLNGTRLATLVTGFIAVYWTSRLMIQFFYLDRAGFPAGRWHKLGEVVLVTLFISLSIIYSWACYSNINHH